MNKSKMYVLVTIATFVLMVIACSNEDDNDNAGMTIDVAELPACFSGFDVDNVTFMVDGAQVIIESNGLPNHESPYWDQSNPLYEESSNPNFNPAPGNIRENPATLTVQLSPEKASSPTSTTLGPIGIAVTGAMIYNDNEGPNVPIDNALVSLDKNGAHTGPVSYHYHLEPISFSDDDSNLIGILSDGFFLFGRRCINDEYPLDLDESGGHTSASSCSSESSYHYHIQNELYLNQYYILFDSQYQGTPSRVNQ